MIQGWGFDPSIPDGSLDADDKAVVWDGIFQGGNSFWGVLVVLQQGSDTRADEQQESVVQQTQPIVS